MCLTMYDQNRYYWGNAVGASSIFGCGGMGGFCNFPLSGTNYANGGDAINYGAGGGGGGYCNGTRWTSGGDGMTGVVILEVQ